MDIQLLIPLVEKIKGCTFASLDALSQPKPGVIHKVTSERILLFRTMDGVSGYENKVKRHLMQAGKDPDSFKVGPLPWGERLGNLPIITHNGEHYLQTILLAPGKHEYYLAFSNIPIDDPKVFGVRKTYPQPGLSPADQVHIHTYKLSSIIRLTLMGETLEETGSADTGTNSIMTLHNNNNGHGGTE